VPLLAPDTIWVLGYQRARMLAPGMRIDEGDGGSTASIQRQSLQSFTVSFIGDFSPG
jgi:hypothetical protein